MGYSSNLMRKEEILSNIRGNGGFDNFRKWTSKEISEWVYNNYNCTTYTAKKVAIQIK